VIAWTIAGSDSGGGAGIQADLKTFARLGVHGCSVVCAVTAQNTRAVSAVAYISEAMIRSQIEALRTDLPPKAIKTGMLGSAAIIAVVARAVAEIHVPLVCDPVMVATSGGRLLEPAAETAMRDLLIPRAALLTPNLPEAEVLWGRKIRGPEDMQMAAEAMLAMGAASVLIKGGHGGDAFCEDYWTDGEQSLWLRLPRIETTHTHGSGCTLSAAHTACLADGFGMLDALVIARAYINQGLRLARPVGGGNGPVHQGEWPMSAADMPLLVPDGARLPAQPFPACGPLGFYPLVARATDLERLISLGVDTVQLRIKDLAGAALEAEIGQAISMARRGNTRLFINDHWRLALALGAYGVHLGQEDLADVDWPALAASGLRLGVSTHGYAELARALALQPSYIAVGPVFATTSKRKAPLGLGGFARLAAMTDRPVVAIGGIDTHKVAALRQAGASGLAVISALDRAPDRPAAVATWRSLCT